jgi:hypothetical protein
MAEVVLGEFHRKMCDYICSVSEMTKATKETQSRLVEFASALSWILTFWEILCYRLTDIDCVKKNEIGHVVVSHLGLAAFVMIVVEYQIDHSTQQDYVVMHELHLVS